MFTSLTDYPQAKHLAAALWRGAGQTRGAALIVGAGVSTMAHTASEHTPRPPLWKDLADSLKAQLYLTNPDWAPTDPLRLAQEFGLAPCTRGRHAMPSGSKGWHIG